MQIKLFTFPIFDTDKEEAINKFLRSVKVLEFKKEIVTDNGHSYWAVSVLFIPNQTYESNGSLSKNKVDYKEILSDEEFKKFCNYRKLRKQIAESDAVPAFAVFTDYELSEITKLDVISEATLLKINGIGIRKIEKYGKKFCDLLNNLSVDEENNKSI